MASTKPPINATLRSEPVKQLAANKARVESLMKLNGNDVCADCPIANPDWASINLGIFLCLPCSGVHRSIGVHVSKVKSVQLDDWNTDWVENMESWGNERSNREVWEAKVPSGRSRPTEREANAAHSTSDVHLSQKLEQWIRDKYEKKMFAQAEKNDDSVSRPHGESEVRLSGLGVGKNLKRLNKMFTADMVVKKRIDTDDELEDRDVFHNGTLRKRGRKNKSWRARTFEISRGELSYYETTPVPPKGGQTTANTGGWANANGAVPPPPAGGTKLRGYSTQVSVSKHSKAKGTVDLAACALLLPPAATGAHDVSKKGVGATNYFVLLCEKPQHRMIHLAALSQHDHMQWIDRLQLAIAQARKRRTESMAPVITPAILTDGAKIEAATCDRAPPQTRSLSLMHWAEERSTKMMASLCDGTANSGAPVDRQRNITIGGSELMNPMIGGGSEQLNSMGGNAGTKQAGKTARLSTMLVKRLTGRKSTSEKEGWKPGRALSGASAAGEDDEDGTEGDDGDDDFDAGAPDGGVILPSKRTNADDSERNRAKSTWFGFGPNVQIQLDEAVRLETHLVVAPSHPLGVAFSETKEGGMVIVTRSEVPGLEVGSLVLLMNGRPVGELALKRWQKGEPAVGGARVARVSGVGKGGTERGAEGGGGGHPKSPTALVKNKLSADGWKSHKGSSTSILIKGKQHSEGLRRIASRDSIKKDRAQDNVYWPMKRFQYAWSESDSLLGVELVVLRPPALVAFATKRSRSLHGRNWKRRQFVMAAGKLGYYTIPKEPKAAKKDSESAHRLSGHSLSLQKETPYDIMHNASLGVKASGVALQGVIELGDCVCGPAFNDASAEGDGDDVSDEEAVEEVRRSWMAERMSGMAKEKHTHSLAIIQSSEDRMLVDMGSSMELSRWLVALTHGTQFARGALSEGLLVRLYAQIGIGITDSDPAEAPKPAWPGPDYKLNGSNGSNGGTAAGLSLPTLEHGESMREGLNEALKVGGEAEGEGGDGDDNDDDEDAKVVSDDLAKELDEPVVPRKPPAVPPPPPEDPDDEMFDDSFFD
jgi:hypothetical protein